MKSVSKNRKGFIKGEEITQYPETPIVNVDSDDSIENMFRNEQNSMQNDVKELFHEDKVKARSDISNRQIKLITKAYYLASITGMSEIHAILKDFLTLSISKDRKSRAEYVQGLQNKLDNALQQSMINTRGQFGK